MALTPSQMGTKSRTLTSPSTNIRSRPNGLGRSPRMGRVQQVSPYQLGELVETPMGLRRIMGITPFSMNVDLGPRGKLAAKANSGTTTISVKKFNKSVPFNVGDLLIIGGPTDSFRETVKIGTAVTISSSTVSVSLSSALKNSHQAGALVVSQKLPPDYDGEFIEIEELRILGDDKYAYVIPSVPKQPRYISRTGTFGDDTAKDQETATGIDPTLSFQRYETIPLAIYQRHTQTGGSPEPADMGSPPYNIFVIGYNEDGSPRPFLAPGGENGGEEVLVSSHTSGTTPTLEKNPMILTGTIIEKGSTEARSVWSQTRGGTYSPEDRYLRLNVPENYYAPEFLTAEIATMFASFTSAQKVEIRAIDFTQYVIENIILNNHRNSGTGLFPLPADGFAIMLNVQKNPTLDQFIHTHGPTNGLIEYNIWNAIEYPKLPYKNPVTAGYVMPQPYIPVFSYGMNEVVVDSNNNPAIYLSDDPNFNSDAFFCNQDMLQTIKITGTVSVSGTTVTGSGTSFLSELSDTTGDRKSVIFIPGSGGTGRHIVTNIASNTSLTIGTSAITAVSGKNCYITDFEDVPLTRLDLIINDASKMLSQRIEFRGTTTASNDHSGSISQRVFLQLPQGQPRWAAKKALDNNKNEDTGFIDAFQSPEDSPNETFAFYVGKNEESLPYMKTSNKTGETVLDGRVKLSGFIIDAPRVEAQELKKIRQRAGYYKAKLFPHTGYFPNLSDRPDGPPDGWEPKSRREKRNLLEALKALSAEVKKEMRGG